MKPPSKPIKVGTVDIAGIFRKHTGHDLPKPKIPVSRTPDLPGNMAKI